jgi:hypothetical protein
MLLTAISTSTLLNKTSKSLAVLAISVVLQKQPETKNDFSSQKEGIGNGERGTENKKSRSDAHPLKGIKRKNI